MGKVRDAMARDLQLRELATSTVDAYLRGARGLVAFYRRPPTALTREEILDYAAHMRDRGLSPSSRRVYLAAIRFMYRVTLRQPEKVENLPVPKVVKRKLRVLKGSEILRLRGPSPTVSTERSSACSTVVAFVFRRSAGFASRTSTALVDVSSFATARAPRTGMCP